LIKGTSSGRIRGMVNGTKMERRRKELGLTLADVAKAAGCSPIAISRYERNAVGHPSLVVIRRIEDALRLAKGDLFD